LNQTLEKKPIEFDISRPKNAADLMAYDFKANDMVARHGSIGNESYEMSQPRRVQGIH